ncbi:MAG: hypothetical protein II597_00105 [Prevotella sp.]|nr:hypothetical protein [Prevotella sp.]
MEQMNKTILMVVAAIMVTLSAEAQRIRTIDKKGQSIPFVSVMTTDNKYIGVTDVEGVIDDVKGADTIMVSHVAYKTKLYKVNGKSGSITLEDADFGLPEIVVKKKPYVYVQTYYRTYMYDEKDGIMYYRVGLTDNVYDIAKKELKASTKHVSKASMGIIKFAVNTLIGDRLDRQSRIKRNKLEKAIVGSNSKLKMKITDEGKGRKHISDFKGTVGYITDNMKTGQRIFSYNNSLIRTHELEAEGNTKKLKKQEARRANEKNQQQANFHLYNIDENGNYSPEDFVMSQLMSSWDEVQKDSSLVHNIICSQVFNVERAYVDKNELKQKKKENKMKMTYENVREFERTHNIPPLSPNIQKRLNELWKMDKDD